MDGFKLKIGEVVVHVVHRERPMSDERMMIVGRRIEECVGGVQRWYCCRVCAPLHLNEVILLHTFEVVAIEDSENEKAT